MSSQLSPDTESLLILIYVFLSSVLINLVSNRIFQCSNIELD